MTIRAAIELLAGGAVGLFFGVLDELVDAAAVFGLLLRRLIVVLVAGQRLGVGQPLRVVLVRVLVGGGPAGPVLEILLYRPFPLGVPGLAWKGVPSVSPAYR